MQRRRCLAMPGIRGECKLGDKCRFEHDPKSSADEKGKRSKGKGKSGK